MFNSLRASFAAAVLAATPGLAQAPAQAPAAPAQSVPAANSVGDPNEVICERQEVIGSRLGKKKVCMTRSQWADRKLQDRQDLEKTQVQRGMITGN